jgi:hypothetical protein
MGAQGRLDPGRLDQPGHRRRLPTRDDETVEALQLLRGAHLDRFRAELAQRLRVRFEVALEG